MPRLSLLDQTTAGVDMLTNPLTLPPTKVVSAVNIQFQDGTIKTRPGIKHQTLGVRGVFQGVTTFSPSRGLSHKPFADPVTTLIVAVSGKVHVSTLECGEVLPASPICGEPMQSCGTINLFQAENYLVIQSQSGSTAWWEGAGCYVTSPGLEGECGTIVERLAESQRIEKSLPGAEINCCFQRIDYCVDEPVLGEEEEHSSHDTLDFTKHKNFLINSAGLGVYAHGRIHQQAAYSIFVSDLIHKRGPRKTDDILLMEEQMSASMSPPLSTNSKLGQLRALEVLPQLNTANGEGDIVAYYDRGVVTYNTGIGSRETRHDAEGKRVRDGWDTQRQVTHLLNSVSAVGRYAVWPLPRDHVFRSKVGLHFLKTVIGEGTFKDEFINTFSHHVKPILDADSPHLLSGSTVGQWEENHRVIASVGMRHVDYLSSETFGRGFVVWNQAASYTEDRTPRSLWEGLWLMDEDMAGVHRLMSLADTTSKTSFGAVTSDSLGNLFFSEFADGSRCDQRNGDIIPIEWSVTTGKQSAGSLSSVKAVSGGRLEVVLDTGSRVRVMFNTDETEGWHEWDYIVQDKDGLAVCNLDLGSLPAEYKEATWFQFRVEGLGYAEILDFDIEYSDKSAKMNKSIPCKEFSEDSSKYFTTIEEPQNTRWTI